MMLAQLSSVKEFILCYSPELSLHMQGNTLTLNLIFVLSVIKVRRPE